MQGIKRYIDCQICHCNSPVSPSPDYARYATAMLCKPLPQMMQRIKRYVDILRARGICKPLPDHARYATAMLCKSLPPDYARYATTMLCKSTPQIMQGIKRYIDCKFDNQYASLSGEEMEGGNFAFNVCFCNKLKVITDLGGQPVITDSSRRSNELRRFYKRNNRFPQWVGCLMAGMVQPVRSQ
ncbi:hypothetical protein CEXT_482901 [Caerostris extrusa]|uniref:Uncharacterized protein n=1 Tax=Caerostris extrusa TaxID=172846 RepID=A0AAV4RW85_CAEEX|nr:hypothetical protein CEXT_482901 [Caerostris extrusa]